MTNIIQSIEKIILDLAFPTSCLGCHQSNELICKKCLKVIPRLTVQVCPFCEKTIMPDGKTCRLCKDHQSPAVDQLIVASDYQDELLTRAIHLFKYKFIRDLASPLGKIMARSIEKSEMPTPDLIVPVPLHSRRLRWRGFNQAELLAEEIAGNILPGINLPIRTDLIYRSRYTSPQMKIKGYQERQKNIEDAFELNPDVKIKTRQNILIVDDVCTTGSTIFQCAHQLKKLRPKKVTAIVLARQS